MGQGVVRSQNICLPTIPTNSLQSHPKEVLIYTQMVFLEHTVSAHVRGCMAPSSPVGDDSEALILWRS